MSGTKRFLTNLKVRFAAFTGSRTGKRAMRLVGLFFAAAIIAYLVYKLTLIGWDKVLEALPRTPWFYLLLLLIFFALPVFQVFIYRVAWKIKPWALFLALLNKRALDKDVLGYSGEMYLYAWARRYVDKPDREILHVLKDNMILSSAASTLVAVVLLTIFFIFGQVRVPREWLNPNVTYLAITVFCLLLAAGLAVKFRKSILFLKRNQVLAIFGLHICRLLAVQGLQVVQWAVVMPEVPLVHWFTLLAAQIIITRIPLLPGRDLIFLGTGIEISQSIGVSAPAMAGMLLAAGVIGKILNLVFFILVFFTLRKRKPAGPAGGQTF